MLNTSDNIHALQRSFRAVMNAFAHPGRIEHLDINTYKCTYYAEVTDGLSTLIDMLVDQATSFACAERCSDEMREAVVRETHAKIEQLDTAQFVIIPQCCSQLEVSSAIVQACAGTLESPEKGATVIVECTTLSVCSQTGAGDVLFPVEVKGPGVKDTNTFYVDDAAWANARNARADEFPCGIDIVLIDDAGAMVALPRTSSVKVADSSEVGSWGM